MATIRKLPSGNWRAQVRRKGQYVNETFRRFKDAEEWALDTERRIDRGETPTSRSKSDPTTFAYLIELHIEDMKAVGRVQRRSKVFSLEALERRLGKVKLAELTRERLIKFGRDRAKGGAGPVTLGADFAYIRALMLHGAAVHGLKISIDQVSLARTALKHLGLIGKGKSRDRRPTVEEIQKLEEYFESNPRQLIPMSRIVRFAIATAMRQDEICRLLWKDVDEAKRMVTIRDRKDPRQKDGNDQKIPLLDVNGYDAWGLIEEQRPFSKRSDRVFPYDGRSIGTAFRRACRALNIEDLHFHDLRHEGASRLFEAGFPIEKVALVTGHKDWKQLKRYTNLRPEDLHKFAAAQKASRVA
ncbi:MAG TPA: site-specific integrase [Rhizomicrobium sp.]|nr:site-specific integrase [Rhizomicrobium sp.]